ncbi:MAG: hypothetical protein SPL75_02815 [Bacilli bacterium]|nr:hypothetical protein [Bacilli bacterium]
MENKEILSLLKEVKKTIEEKKDSQTLVSNCYYLRDNSILALRNPDGDSRYPYSVNGLTLWAHASGNIYLNQADFFLFPPCLEGKQPYLNFYGGIKNKNGQYNVFSLTGAAETEFGLNYPTYTIYKASYCYYIKEIQNIIFCLKLGLSENKRALFSLSVINKSKKEKDVFVSAYINPLLIHSAYEDEETKWFKTVNLTKDGAVFTTVEDLSREIHLYNYASLKRAHNGDGSEISTRREDYVGDKNYGINNSLCLRDGSFRHHQKVATFSDMAIFGDIVKKTINKENSLFSNYCFSFVFDEAELKKLEEEKYDLNTNENLYKNLRKNQQFSVKLGFSEIKDYKLNNELLNHFIASTMTQVDYSSTTKNSSLKLLGIRDLYQMLEVSLMWNPQNARKRILESLSYIDPTGRAPRQYAPKSSEHPPLFDNREFIDQGQWIISTIYKYLAFTNDKSLLKGKCGYYELIERHEGREVDLEETVYQHLERIVNYLIENIDPETHCLKALYGDWNDAVDGLGASETSKFGNGVSVMATEHLYKNLFEMDEIADYFGKKNKPDYLSIAKEVEEGLLKNAIQEKNGEKRIVHGWGENKSFYVGSFLDIDRKSRLSSTSNSFFVISGLYEKHPEMKDTILGALKGLDSKYGAMTFDQYFNKKDAYKVGRIINLPKGTAENAATYIHAGMFFVRALYMMNEGKLAFDQIYKLIPITHSKITTSPFVMPNSYVYNPELGLDGESMSDWYTGSSNTFLKALIFDLFGIQPRLDGSLKINPSNYFPSDEASLSFKLRNKKVTVVYKNKHLGKRKIFVNDEKLNGSLIDVTKIKSKLEIKIID